MPPSLVPDSRRNSARSLAPPPSIRGRSARQTVMTFTEDSKYGVILEHLFNKTTASNWIPSPPIPRDVCAGTFIRKGDGSFMSEPAAPYPELLAAVEQINPEVLLTMSTHMTGAVFDALQPGDRTLILADGSQIQVFETMAHIATSTSLRKFQYAAFVRKEKVLLVWHDDIQRVFPHAIEMEQKLLASIWGGDDLPFESGFRSGFRSNISSAMASTVDLNGQNSTVPPSPTTLGPAVSPEDSGDEAEKVIASNESLGRPLVFTSAILVGLAVLLVFCALGLAARSLVFQSVVDGQWMRMALLAAQPFIAMLGLFFAIICVTLIFELVGPITSIKQNSRYYSAIKPDLARARSLGFTPPPITIQMPVYTEGLQAVIIPTVKSLKKAISYYESHGGRATIFINDDGMAYRSPEENEERIKFYRDNNIGWVARPKNNDPETGYVRRGKFKKASNMNFALNISNRVEDALQAMVDARYEKDEGITEEEEAALYQAALKKVLDEEPRARAGGNVRMGEYILIVDSDTEVPEDCLLYGAGEMFLSPEVAIVQHSTGVMQVQWDYFENAIAYFTNVVYTAIRFSVGNGEVAPFVGHNAFLRWQAVQSVGNVQEDGFALYWSESSVSEDFDIALRLQIGGNTVRMASYHNDEFKEGVSLTIGDELNRWEKYAYGCNELVFNPIHTWLWKGPFTKLFRTFVAADIQLSSKISVIGYISSYYAIAAAVPLGLLNYLLIGWFNGDLDQSYIESWQIWTGLVFVFNLVANVALAVLRYRIGDKPFLPSLLENFKWVLVFVIFFSGLSFHLNLAILAHMFSINMSWGATNKEKNDSNFFREMPMIWNRFKWMFLFMIALIGMMVYLGIFAPRGWDISGVTTCLPLAIMIGGHVLLPFALNPALMVFNY
ncbi:glycosyl transferase family group 2-domain-containing protein [Lineolata rhizophorae]|uniref:Glycosyl transferase family group 2-domain-containing protein n=1 Tax=Lineolata rhizophorae TaxID=578093 RepID=A0A6A6NXB7_9PEZI|nr:glycosyl transferase family group 2-domain-containing protein [Lineolata rhizophorae]